jgi:hypothetical protein
MARLYEFEITRGVVEEITKDVGLSLSSDIKENIVDILMRIVNDPWIFQKASMDGLPGLRIRVGQICTERFTGQGLHAFNHSGSEGYLYMLEFDKRLQSSLDRQGVLFIDRTDINSSASDEGA